MVRGWHGQIHRLKHGVRTGSASSSNAHVGLEAGDSGMDTGRRIRACYGAIRPPPPPLAPAPVVDCHAAAAIMMRPQTRDDHRWRLPDPARAYMLDASARTLGPPWLPRTQLVRLRQP